MPNLRPKIQDYRLGLVYGGAYLNFLVICSHWNKITPTLSSPPSSPVTGNQELNPDTISFDGSNYATLTGESSCLFFSSFVLKTRPNGFWKLFRFDSKGQRLKKKWTRTISRAFSKTLIVNGTVWCAHPQYPGHIRSMHVGAGYRQRAASRWDMLSGLGKFSPFFSFFSEYSSGSNQLTTSIALPFSNYTSDCAIN
jgi:hypothetical protein